MTRRGNAVSIDELRREEEGCVWPSRRQRFTEPVGNASTFGNVETGSVNGSSSLGWSDWRTSDSLPRTSNQWHMGIPAIQEDSGGNMTSWDAPALDDEGSGVYVTSWNSLPLDPDEDSRENMTSWESLPLDPDVFDIDEGSRENVTSWDSLPLDPDEDSRENTISWESLPLDEGSRENVTSLNQIGSNTALQNGWLTVGANGLQMAATESFEVEEVPYSWNVNENLRMALPDAVKCITEKKYLGLTKYGLPCNYSANRIRKVLASIVIKREVAYRNSRLCIVSLGAGSKAIDGRSLSKQGDRVHDCHAEVLARRGMLRFLYSQLEKIKNGCQHRSNFVKNEGSEVYTIRDGVSFHLFISKPPCGDASVFGLHEFHPNRLNRGIARATPSNGEGAVYIPKDDKTFDDFKLGARLHKMCCSAKIARWNVIGIQGALLSLYIQPVYLSSITIGSDFNVSHMTRAVYGRVSKINCLPSCYQVKNPSLYKVQHSNNRKDKPHKMSLNWCLQHPKPELIECLEGTRFLGGASQLAKRELFKCFISLWDSLAPQELKREASRVIGGEDVGHYPYDKMKDLADNYQRSKWKIAEHFFLQQHYGSRWLKMPREVDQFSLREENSEVERFRD